MFKFLIIIIAIAFVPAMLVGFDLNLVPVLYHHHEIIAAGLAVPAAATEPLAFTIREFCKAHALGVASYYKLKAVGLGPREMHLTGNLIRISAEAAAEWRAARENPEGAEAKDLARRFEQRQKRSRLAASRAVQSPDHPANRNREVA
jgi:hypothetical protein